MRKLKELAQEVLDVQDASNLTGVVHSFSRAMADLRLIYPDKDTKFFNEHPITVLWVDKLSSLSRHDAFGLAINIAFDAVKSLAKEA